MRLIFSAVVAIVLMTGAVRASTISIALGVGPSSGSAATAMKEFDPPGFVNVKVYVFAKVDTLQDLASNSSLDNHSHGFIDETGLTSAGGVAGFQFSITGDVTDSVNYNSAITSTIFAQQAGFGSSAKPTRTYDGGGGFNAANGLFETSPDPSNYTNTTLGTPDSSTIMKSGPFVGYDLIATENWTISMGFFGDVMTPTITGAFYYDSTEGNQNFLTAFTNVNTSNAIFGITPEPAFMDILGISVLSLIVRGHRVEQIN